MHQNKKLMEDGFKVPESYFEELNTSIHKAIARDKEENSFKVPANYFDSLSTEIHNRVNTKIIPLHQKAWFKFSSIAVAAGLALFLFFDTATTESSSESFTSMLENTELQDEDLSWIENELVEEFYAENSSPSQMTAEDEILMEYVLENDWDVEYLIESE